MSVCHTRRNPFARGVAATLLVIQGLVAGTVGVVHAGEALSAPPAIEAHHGSGCVVVHDPARCASCQLGTGALPPQAQRRSPADDGPRYRATALATVAPSARPLSRATPPRAPPVFSA